MSDKNNLTFQTVDCGLCKRDVFGEGFRRILHHSDVVTFLPKYVVDTCPSRAVYKPAVNQNNRFAALLIRFLHTNNECLSFVDLFFVVDWALSIGRNVRSLESRQLIPCFLDRDVEI